MPVILVAIDPQGNVVGLFNDLKEATECCQNYVDSRSLGQITIWHIEDVLAFASLDDDKIKKAMQRNIDRRRIKPERAVKGYLKILTERSLRGTV